MPLKLEDKFATLRQIMSWVEGDPLAPTHYPDKVFSVMAQPVELLHRLPQKLVENGWVRLSTSSSRPLWAGGSATGLAPDGVQDPPHQNWDEEIQAGQVQGGVVELRARGGVALGTSLALAVCRAAQERARLHHGQSVWCAFIDPRGSLYAPGVAAKGVDLQRLLVLRPDESSVSRVALRLVEARVFPVIVIDTTGVPGASVDGSLSRWVQAVRRLERALPHARDTVILLTNEHTKSSLPLPVTKRYELMRNSACSLNVRLTRNTKTHRLYSGQFPVKELVRRRTSAA